jgi:single-stranded-DNA-specific exonuclease
VRWNLRASDAERVQALAEEIGSLGPVGGRADLSRILAELLLLRGIDTAESAATFLSPSLDQLHSPYLMAGVRQAVDRLDAAIERKEGILIYGDYDVDGTTAVVILKTAIELSGGAADFHVPHRIREGYDLRGDVIECAAQAGITLVISVDAGTRAFRAAESARRAGVDLIITDHHLPGPDGLPRAFAVVNPNQPGCSYPSKSLCGAGIALKLAQALMARRLAHRDQAQLMISFSKIAALATIADSVPLVGENRVIAHVGLNALRSAVNPGLRALLEISNVGGRAVSSGEVAFRIAPRLNAAGRMDVARDVIELFSAKDQARAREIAARLDQQNSQRQQEERRILEEIERLGESQSFKDACCLVVAGNGWHRGVIGITAARLVERYRRPALVVSSQGEEAHGSGRSISGFHLLNALESCSHLFARYGGHAYAVGFSLPASRIMELRTQLETYARQHLSPSDFDSLLHIDTELPLERITPELVALLRTLEPFGAGNPRPVFAAPARICATPKVLKEKHARFKLSPGCPDPGSGWRQALTHSAIGWRLAERLEAEKLLAGDLVDVAYSLEENDHPEFGGVELSLRDFQVRVAARSRQPA